MISSTARDLPEHRQAVLDACVRQGCLPKMMEHLPASHEEALTTSLTMVDEADIYIGLFAHTYGFVPRNRKKSITHLEYERAVKRKIPRLVFIMHEDHPVTKSQIETGDGAARIASLKTRLLKEQVVNFFRSPDELRAQVINSLAALRQRLDQEMGTGAPIAPRPRFLTTPPAIEMPCPPEPYIPHPYTLLQTENLIGRKNELKCLTDWLVNAVSQITTARIFLLVSIGGMGKTALAWKWFHDIAPTAMTGVTGRIWWSFYDDERFHNFVSRTLAYTSKRPLDEVTRTAFSDQIDQLLYLLDRTPFILVLDGFERVLAAYATLDAAHVPDDSCETQTEIARRIRQCADPRVGQFLLRLSRLRASRTLISSRLVPSELETVTEKPLPGTYVHHLPGLDPDDAVGLWHGIGVTGGDEELRQLFSTFDYHPLLVQALAREVAGFRRAPADFTAWRACYPEFDPCSLPLKQRKSHILHFAMSGLDDDRNRVLRTIAHFRTPARYDTLVGLLVGPHDAPRIFCDCKCQIL